MDCIILRPWNPEELPKDSANSRCLPLFLMEWRAMCWKVFCDQKSFTWFLPAQCLGDSVGHRCVGALEDAYTLRCVPDYCLPVSDSIMILT